MKKLLKGQAREHSDRPTLDSSTVFPPLETKKAKIFSNKLKKHIPLPCTFEFLIADT
jgi:hypothetical protein